MREILLLSAGAGFGLWLMYQSTARHAPPLQRAITTLEQPGQSVAERLRSPGAPRRSVTFAQQVRTGLASLGIDLEKKTSALRLAGKTPEQFALSKLTTAVAMFMIPVMMAATSPLHGFSLPLSLVCLLAIGLGVFGFVFPDFSLQSEVEERRKGFLHALSAYLDLVHIILEGGGGIEEAMWSAADAGEGWAFDLIGETLDHSRLTGESIWNALERLGDELGIEELQLVAGTVTLAGQDGAAVRRSLAQHAESLRMHQLRETESYARAATERMVLPTSFTLFCFLGFVLWPSITKITGG